MRDTPSAADPGRIAEMGGRAADDSLGFLTRDELLGGLPARRASTLLFAIESRTTHLVKRSRIPFGAYRSETGEVEREHAFLEALAQGRDQSVRPTIQELERHAPRWASLVPVDEGVRAALAKMIGETYPLPATGIPSITAALGLATTGVAARYQALYGQPLQSVFTTSVGLGERWRWLRSSAAARLESLPPFWTAFAVTLTETVGAGILALPIAFASVGPIAGVVVIAILGLISVGTIAAMSEAVARNGNVRYGRGFFRRMVDDYLGPTGASVLTPALLCYTVLILLVYFIGFASTLADASGLPAELWAAGLFLILMVFLRRDSLDAPIASALAVGATTIGLILLLCLLALPHLAGANLRHAEIPFWHGRPFDRSLLGLVFGVVLCAFFGHTTTANYATVVLDRDPSGRSLIRGSSCALLAALGLYALWVLAVNGAVAPSALAGQSGTAIGPLAREAGNGVYVVGVVFVVLAMGMAAVHYAFGLSYQARDLLPRGSGGPIAGLRGALAAPRARRLVGFGPVVFIFAIVELLFATGHESFAGPIGFVGLITIPLIAGVFPMLMLASARRKGDCAVAPGRALIGHPVVVAAAVLLFVTSIAVHGLFIWDDPIRRVVAMLTTVAILAVLVPIRRVAFVPRAVVEVRFGDRLRGGPAVIVLARGEPIATDVEWTPDEFAGMLGGERGTLRIDLPAVPVRELKVWVHRLTGEGDSEAVSARVEIASENESSRTEVGPPTAQAIVPADGGARRVVITHLSDGRAGGQR